MPSTAFPALATDGGTGATLAAGRVAFEPRALGVFRNPNDPPRCMGSSVHWVLKRARQRADARLVIELHRLHGNGTFFVNPDLVEVIEACPDTVVTLVNKHRYVVEDPVAVVVQRIVDFRARIAAAAGTQGDHAAGTRVVALNENEERAA